MSSKHQPIIISAYDFFYRYLSPVEVSLFAPGDANPVSFLPLPIPVASFTVPSDAGLTALAARQASPSSTPWPQTCHSPFNFRWAGQHNDDLSQRTYLLTNWDALIDVVKQLSGDPACVYQGDFHAGGRHIVRRIGLPQKGGSWIARIPTIPAPFDSDDIRRWWTSEEKFAMESEIATMRYVAQHTDVPVPEVFGYETGMDRSPVGLPYLLMQCIGGNMLFDLGGPGVLTDEQRAKIRRSVASIQCKLMDAPLTQLGSLILKPDGGIDIGPLPAAFGFEGPFRSTADYFLSWARHNTTFKNSHLLGAHPSLRQAAQAFPRRLASTVESLVSPEHSGDGAYPILHPDFLMHNILLDDDYEVVGIIDWEYAHSAPVEVFAARTNMYASFSPDLATSEWHDDDDEGARYAADVEAIPSQKLSGVFGSLLGDVGLCMRLFEEGVAVPFDRVLDPAWR
ncbi:kinase-like domain-containing protein [Coniochaeta sp. 2T2.1]|nr:kinase-like domain-containing protein [Coniochaeta sp. 2T2.1]